MKNLTVLSWNVNGIRAAAKKGFEQWFNETQPDVLGLQEVRALHDVIPPEIRDPEGYQTHFVAAERKGYSGVGLFSKQEAKFSEISLADEALDAEGRLQVMELGPLKIVNGYFPTGTGKNRDNSRIPFKLEFYDRLLALLEQEKEAGRPIIVMGDWNTAHMPIDLARPKQNAKTSGFCAIEREALDRWVQAGWVDTFRQFHDTPDNYTWWSQRFGVREKNIGWRIDYIFASPAALPFVKDAFIWPNVMGSDHCPIGIQLDPGVLKLK